MPRIQFDLHFNYRIVRNQLIMGNISFVRIFVLCLFGVVIDGSLAEDEISRVKRDKFYIDQVAARVGCFVTRSYNVSGTVWLIHNSTQLYIENFSFDGEDNGVSFTFNIGKASLFISILQKCFMILYYSKINFK